MCPGSWERELLMMLSLTQLEKTFNDLGPVLVSAPLLRIEFFPLF